MILDQLLPSDGARHRRPLTNADRAKPAETARERTWSGSLSFALVDGALRNYCAAAVARSFEA